MTTTREKIDDLKSPWVDNATREYVRKHSLIFADAIDALRKQVDTQGVEILRLKGVVSEEPTTPDTGADPEKEKALLIECTCGYRYQPFHAEGGVCPKCRTKPEPWPPETGDEAPKFRTDTGHVYTVLDEPVSEPTPTGDDGPDELDRVFEEMYPEGSEREQAFRDGWHAAVRAMRAARPNA